MPHDLLKNRVAIITGAGRGIGKAIAEKFASEDCNLALLARSGSELQETSEELKRLCRRKIKWYSVDVSQEQNVREVVNSVIQEFGHVDVLVNNAGILGPVGPLPEIDGEDWLKTIQINLSGVFFCIKAVLPDMIRRNYGRVINISGGGALLPAPFFDAYSVAKAGVVRLTENLALELREMGSDKIAVCAIAPSGVNTKMFDDMMAAGQDKVGAKIWGGFLKRQTEGGDSIEEPAALSLYLATADNALPLNGRVISAKWDPWRSLKEHASDLSHSDIYMMRRIKPDDRGKNW